MNITKLGHCCLVLEENGMKILTDPGSFTTEPVKAVTGINIILITHEHTDHYHIESIEAVLKNNPGAVVVSNSAVAKLLAEKDMSLHGGRRRAIRDRRRDEWCRRHIDRGIRQGSRVIYGTMGLRRKHGISRRRQILFPRRRVPRSEAADRRACASGRRAMDEDQRSDRFCKVGKPRVAFGVHDGMVVPGFGGFVAMMFQNFLKPDDIEYVALGVGE